MFGKRVGFLRMDQHQMHAASIKRKHQISRSRYKDQKSSDEEENTGDNEEEEEYDEKEETDKNEAGEALDDKDYQGSENEGRSGKSVENKETNQLATGIIEVQKSSDEEEADDVEEEDDEEHYDEKKDDIKEEQDATEQNVNQIPEYEGQNIKSCGSEEKSYVLTETIKKENAIPEKDTSKQEGENAEVCVTNTSDLAVAGSRDRTSGRLLDKFSFFKRKSSKRKNEHNSDENKPETLPQSEGKKENQSGVSDDKSKDENQNHSSANQRELQPANHNRKTSSTCIIL
uniref:Uncharacterized protein n=1 Tax=Pogona vitticeps TaxID=103695 RepID=A0ABM5FY64_9SAUR